MSTDFVFTPAATPSLAIKSPDRNRFPVRRIICVGQNYAAHAREMGGDPTRDAPVFFTKPADAVVDVGSEHNATVPYPPLTDNLHYEIELVVAIGQGGAQIPVSSAAEHIWGAGVGVDLTRRDLQAAAKAKGRPWDWAKGFDYSAPCGPLTPRQQMPSLDQGRIWLAVNGQTRQDADLNELIWSIPEIIAICSQGITLAPGDLIFTGTPAGVGALHPGDVVTGGVAGLEDVQFTVGPARTAAEASNG